MFGASYCASRAEKLYVGHKNLYSTRAAVRTLKFLLQDQ
jgi:hypothetical protein